MKIELPDYQKKQELIYRDARPADELIAYGDRSREANRIFDALEFYLKAQHAPGMEGIREIAVSNGDAMLFEQASKALRQNPTADQWEMVGRQASALKKYTFARYAFEKAGNDALQEEVKKISGKE